MSKSKISFFILYITVMLIFYSHSSVAAIHIIFGFDQKLGLPPLNKDQRWAHLTENVSIQVAPYSNLAQLINGLNRGTIEIAFIPAGALFYLKSLDQYDYALSAESDNANMNTVKSYLLRLKVEKNSDLSKLLQQKGLGYVNRYCTTSYFASLVYIFQHVNIRKPIKLTKLKSFKALLINLVKNKVGVIGEWDYIAHQNPNLLHLTDKIGIIDQLPTPIIIINKSLPKFFRKQLTQFLLHYRVPNNLTWGFKGFSNYDKEKINQFMHTVCKLKHQFPFALPNCT